MKQVAVIIKHPYRDTDWRVDIYEVPDNAELKDVRIEAYVKMIGPFEIIAVTEKVNTKATMTHSTTYKLPEWMHKYAEAIGGKGETVEGIEWYIRLTAPTESQQYIITVYTAKIELLESLHNARLI